MGKLVNNVVTFVKAYTKKRVIEKISINDISHHTGITVSSLIAFEKLTSLPNVREIELIANHLGVEVEFKSFVLNPKPEEAKDNE